MPRWIILAILLLVVLGRSAVFVLAPDAYFDSDQAIVGLMAKHLAELRAFPVFVYGQTYVLGVETWLAAPLFALFGPSAALLRLPLLAMNAVIAFLIFRTFEREMGLRPARAALAALPFVLPSVGLTAVLLDASAVNELLSVLGLVGLAGWFLSVRPPVALRAAWLDDLRRRRAAAHPDLQHDRRGPRRRGRAAVAAAV